VLALFSVSTVSATPVIIDTFDTTGMTAFILPGPAGDSANVGGATAGGESVGGFRNIEIERIGAGGVNSVSVTSGNFLMSLAADDTGFGRITWDGDANNTLDHGLAVDLTGLGTNTQIQLGIRSDLVGSVRLIVYSGAGNFSTATFATPAGGFGATPFTIITLPFADPVWVATGLGVDFGNVSAIRLEGDGSSTPGLDLQLNFIEANGVPEPGTFALAGLALCGLAAIRPRKKS
jgi:hypothetical protein